MGAGFETLEKAKQAIQSFRFLLSAQGDYAENTVDPDACFDWDAIEQVVILLFSLAFSLHKYI